MKRARDEEEVRAHFIDGTVSAYGDEEERVLQVTVTHEGIILDAYQDSELVGTKGMTADEWFSELLSQPVSYEDILGSVRLAMLDAHLGQWVDDVVATVEDFIVNNHHEA